MIKLFLTSSFVDVAKHFERFADEEVKGKTITFIPTASIVEEVTFYVHNDKKAFEKLGLIVDELNVTQHSEQEIRNILEKNDYIFISGGNTFYLLQELKNTQAGKLIIDQINKGKLYIGASAGSVILAPNIEYVTKMDDKTKAEKLTSYQSLAVVDFFPLPHHTNPPFKEVVEDIINDFGKRIRLIPISNTQAIAVKGGTIEIIGEK
jgi:dipeptidase E